MSVVEMSLCFLLITELCFTFLGSIFELKLPHTGSEHRAGSKSSIEGFMSYKNILNATFKVGKTLRIKTLRLSVFPSLRSKTSKLMTLSRLMFGEAPH